jgi:hypothetical protein
MQDNCATAATSGDTTDEVQGSRQIKTATSSDLPPKCRALDLEPCRVDHDQPPATKDAFVSKTQSSCSTAGEAVASYTIQAPANAARRIEQDTYSCRKSKISLEPMNSHP